MNRQQRRASARKDEKYKTSTYNLTKQQLDNAVKEVAEQKINEAYEKGVKDGVNEAIVLLLALPMKVLMDFYWKKTYGKRIPEFSKRILEYYERWQAGELDLEQLKDDLWNYGGVRFEVNDGED